MDDGVYREAIRLAGTISDSFVRAVTYARIGYYAYKARNPIYKEAFSRALNAVASIDNPVLMVRALLEVGTFFGRIGSRSSKKVFLQAYELAKSLPQPIRDELLEELAVRLLEFGQVDDALFYVADMENPVRKSDVLLRILGAYLARGNMRKAKRVLDMIEDEPWHSIAAFEVLKEYLRREQFGSAMAVLSELKSEYWLGEAMKTIAFHLKKAEVPPETYEKFVDLTKSMPEEVRSEVLKSLLIGLAVQGEVDFVMQVLRKLDDDIRPGMVESIASSLVGRPAYLKQFLSLLSGDDFERAAAVVMDSLLERQPSDSYRDVVQLIGKKTGLEKTAVKAVRYLSKLHAYDDAWELASRVKDPYLRSLAFGSIAVEKLKENDVDGAIDASLEVKDPRWGSWLLSEILAKILEVQTGGEVKEDIEERAEKQRKLWEGS